MRSGRVLHGARLAALAAGLAIAPPPAPAQTPPETGAPPEAVVETGPALRRFLERTGALIVRRGWSLGSVPLEGGARLRLEAVTAHRPGAEHLRALGIAAEIEGPGTAGTPGPLYVDLGEVDALVRAMRRISETLRQGAPAEGPDRTRLDITTADGFGVGALLEAGRKSRHVHWSGGRRLAIGAEAFERLRETLDAGRRRLFSE